MAKHLKNNKSESQAKDNSLYARIITRQGEGLIEAKKQIEELEKRLVKERMDRIEDLKDIRVLATCNTYNNEKSFLNKIAEITTDKITELTTIKTNKKEISSHTDQDI